MTKPTRTIRVVLPLAATATFALFTGCAPCEQPPAMASAKSGGGNTAVVDLNAPGPHQISVLVIKKDDGSVSAASGPKARHHNTVEVVIEPEVLDSDHYVVTHDRKKDKKVD